MTDSIFKRKSKLSQSPNQEDDIYQEINEKPVFRIFFFKSTGQSCISGRNSAIGTGNQGCATAATVCLK